MPNAPEDAELTGHPNEVMLEECIGNPEIQCWDGPSVNNKKYGGPIVSGKNRQATLDNVFNVIRAMDPPKN